jgi:hypothetical protein
MAEGLSAMRAFKGLFFCMGKDMNFSGETRFQKFSTLPTFKISSGWLKSKFDPLFGE